MASPQQPAEIAEDHQVNAPTATGVVVPLVVLPALIVLGVLLVIVLFGRVAATERSPDDYLADIRAGDHKGWQAALELSQLLGADLAYAADATLAEELTRELERQLARKDDVALGLQEYLAVALGSFRLAGPVPVLRHAAQPGQNQRVRRAAFISLARLADRLDDLRDPELLSELCAYLRGDENSDVRELAAFVLGFLGDRRALGPLTEALQDPVTEVRFNAANALASLGSDAALPVYREMLDYPTLGLGRRPGQVGADEALAFAATASALASLARIHVGRPNTDFAIVLPAVERLCHCDNDQLRDQAREVLRQLRTSRTAGR